MSACKECIHDLELVHDGWGCLLCNCPIENDTKFVPPKYTYCGHADCSKTACERVTLKTGHLRWEVPVCTEHREFLASGALEGVSLVA